MSKSIPLKFNLLLINENLNLISKYFLKTQFQKINNEHTDNQHQQLIY